MLPDSPNPPITLQRAVFLALGIFCVQAFAVETTAVSREERGHYRVLVKLKPGELGARASDEFVASYDLDLDASDSTFPKGRAINFDSVRAQSP